MKQNSDNINSRFKNRKTAVVIPTYNNAVTLSKVIESVLQYTSDVIVVNDGSTDNTSDILAEYSQKLQVISYLPNKGKGFALKTAFLYATEKSYTNVITIDSDGQHSASDLPLFFEAAERYPDSLIVGSRNLNQENMAGKSTFANRFSNFWFTLQTFIKLPDTQSGFRLYPLNKMGNMRIFTRRYETELEILVFSAWRGIKLIPIPISVYYAPTSEKVSHFRPFHDFFRISVLNTVLVFLAIVYGYPSMLLRRLFK
ncbi:MAG: glycosyltransferase family 2 protein [Bacteroidales bacterium]|nr:glycosyltransferase family 2 protein [Bacteroidales bacterium]